MVRRQELAQSEAARALSQVSLGVLSSALFREMCRLIVMPAIEIVPLRISEDGQIEVLLIPRDQEDPVWPGKLHTPGTILRSLDRKGSFNDPFSRILDCEMAGTQILSDPQFVETIFVDSERGAGLLLVYWVEVGTKSPFSFFPVTSLPEGLIDVQRPMIKMAVENFKLIRGLDNNSLESTPLPR